MRYTVYEADHPNKVRVLDGVHTKRMGGWKWRVFEIDEDWCDRPCCQEGREAGKTMELIQPPHKAGDVLR